MGRGTHLFVASALSLVVAGAVTGCAGTHLRNAGGTTGPAKSASRIVLLSSNAAAPAIAALIPTCERAANVRVTVRYANNPVLKGEIEAGAPFDIVVIEPTMLADLGSQGLVDPASTRHLAEIGMALISMTGGPAPRIDDEATFRQALLNARGIGYVGTGHSGIVFQQTIDRMGLRQQLAGKLIPLRSLSPVSEMRAGVIDYFAAPLAVPLEAGLQFVGRFPASVQTYIGVSAATRAAATGVQAQFIACLHSPQAEELFRSRGYRAPVVRLTGT